MELQDAVNVLRGAPGQKVTLTILRPSTKEIKDYALERTEIKVQSVKARRLLDPELTGPFKIGYIRLIQFNEPTADELAKALDEFAEAGDAGAGARSCATIPADCSTSRWMFARNFLPPNTKVVSTQGRVASQQHDYATSGSGKGAAAFSAGGAGE